MKACPGSSCFRVLVRVQAAHGKASKSPVVVALSAYEAAQKALDIFPGDVGEVEFLHPYLFHRQH